MKYKKEEIIEIDNALKKFENKHGIINHINDNQISEHCISLLRKSGLCKIVPSNSGYMGADLKEELTSKGWEVLNSSGGFGDYLKDIKAKEEREVNTFKYAKWSAIFGGITIFLTILFWIIDKILIH